MQRTEVENRIILFVFTDKISLIYMNIKKEKKKKKEK